MEELALIVSVRYYIRLHATTRAMHGGSSADMVISGETTIDASSGC